MPMTDKYLFYREVGPRAMMSLATTQEARMAAWHKDRILVPVERAMGKSTDLRPLPQLPHRPRFHTLRWVLAEALISTAPSNASSTEQNR